MTDCPRFGKLIGGCRFRPRYDEVGASGPSTDAAFWNAVVGDAKRRQLAHIGQKPPPTQKLRSRNTFKRRWG